MQKTKLELITELEMLDKKLKYANPEDEVRIQNKITKARRQLYECYLCADAQIINYIDKKTGEEKSVLAKDCGRVECPYKDYFNEIAKNESLVEDELKKFLKLL